MPSGIMTLMTDFGGDGPYVAAIKGVVLGLAPGVQVVDISHAIEPQNIDEGSFVLASIVDCFPEGTVHLAVVDPGVGTDRRIIAVRAAGQWFVLPDNGLITRILRSYEPTGTWEVSNPTLRRSNVSMTFHGRDIMAPAAAFLLRGGDPSTLGQGIDDLVRLPSVEPIEHLGGITGEVLFRDRFGNLITNIARDRLGQEDCLVEIAGQSIQGLVSTYAERPPGSLVALIGSSDWLEVAVVNGSAAARLGAGQKTRVRVCRRQEFLSR